ncbi:hypothetical protein M378DRAFT_215975 [Amanita muscaria Koide BX008]|uniref:Uncharacterized protein n=1 Tax=Amanita muscaria (strain Koide BX008) TaxID=946122 RepID=A0A0C2T5Y3_AMAMK|nr:hypothetical protein M378DRAFT_215975 [Amanita muscaria Koide BX008]
MSRCSTFGSHRRIALLPHSGLCCHIVGLPVFFCPMLELAIIIWPFFIFKFRHGNADVVKYVVNLRQKPLG